MTLQAQDPQFSQYYAAPLYLNPAFTGSEMLPRIGANYRNQWPGIELDFSGGFTFEPLPALAQDIGALTAETKKTVLPVVPKVVNAVTLEVTPAQAEKIDLARSIGSLSLVLRSQVDVASVDTLGSRKADLLLRTNPLQDNASRPAPTRPVRRVTANQLSKETEKLEVIRGIKKSQESAE